MTTTESCYQKLSNLIAAIDQEWHPESQGQHFTTELCNAIDAARAAADDLPVSAWQPIETAPRDGSQILAWDGKDVLIAWCCKGRWMYDDLMESPYLTPWYPTHWQLLPSPPPITP